MFQSTDQSSTEQSWDESCLHLSVCSRHWCCLTRLQPTCKPAGSGVHPRPLRKSALLPEARHPDHIKPLLVLAVTLQGAATVTLTHTQQPCLVEMKPVVWRENIKNAHKPSPDRSPPLHSAVQHRSCSQWRGRRTRWSGYMFSCQWAPPRLPVICSSSCLQHTNQNGTLLVKGF